MRLSELIAALSSVKQEHGDMEVLSYDSYDEPHAFNFRPEIRLSKMITFTNTYPKEETITQPDIGWHEWNQEESRYEYRTVPAGEKSLWI